MTRFCNNDLCYYVLMMCRSLEQLMLHMCTDADGISFSCKQHQSEYRAAAFYTNHIFSHIYISIPYKFWSLYQAALQSNLQQTFYEYLHNAIHCKSTSLDTVDLQDVVLLKTVNLPVEQLQHIYTSAVPLTTTIVLLYQTANIFKVQNMHSLVLKRS